jgi:hypothetical protein
MCNGIICTSLPPVHQHISKPLACENSEIVLTAIYAKSMKIFVLLQVLYRTVFSYYSTSVTK